MLSILLGWTSAIAQQSSYNHPELKWQTIESEHFAVHFYPGTERTARIILTIADDIYKPITDLYGYHPEGKVHWVVRDHDDYSNGATYYYENKIEIWAKPLDFEFRSTHHWLYDVVTHEFTHMIQLGASRKAPRWLPAVYFQYINYESEKRPDVLYGFPNRLISWPTAMTIVPMWFAEGAAQFQEENIHHDWWDAHRDMMIRVRALADRMLTKNEMEVFGKNSLGSESVYNHGYAMVRWIADRWGEAALADLSRLMASPQIWSFDAACKRRLGLSGKELYHEWTKDTKDFYSNAIRTVQTHETTGKVIFDKGFGNLYPKFSPDGRQLAFISNEGKDYLSLGRLKLYDLERDSIIDIKAPVKGAFDWSPDGRFMVYARQGAPNRQGSHFDDLWLWDTKEEKEIRLTQDARLSTPSFSTDGRRIVAVYNQDGTHNIALVTLPDTLPKAKDISEKVKIERLTRFNDGTQIYMPRFSPDGHKIYCSTANLGPRDLYQYDLESGAWTPLLATPADERDVMPSSDGIYVVFSSDRTGIYNLYRLKLETQQIEPLTNVIGGAFHPDINEDGGIAYSEFTVNGYGISLLENPQPLEPENLRYLDAADIERPHLEIPRTHESPEHAYKSPFNKLFILPRIAWDYDKFKPGFYAYTGDILDRLTLFGGAAYGPHGDRDLYLSAEYRMLFPTLFLEAYNIGRYNAERFDDTFVIVGQTREDSLAAPIYGTYGVEYKFNLMEVDLGGRMPLRDDYQISALFRWSRYKAALDFNDGSGFEYTYHLGKAYILRVDSDQRARSVASDIQPRGGWRGWLEYARENNRFLEGFKVEAERGTIVEVYKPYNYHRIETDLDYYWTAYKGLTLNPRVMAGWLSDTQVDPFFHLYAGGLMGLRGYSFYSLGGSARAVGRLSLRFPLGTGIDRKWGPFYLDRIHGAFFTEVGNAWSGDFKVDQVKRDLGAELRFKLFSWYGFPTDIELAGAYSLDRFAVQDNTGRHQYGREWRWYLTVLFDFI